jgi:uncharacterized protein YqfA (UPF0365 family)
MSKTALLAAGAFAAGKAKEAKKATENADGKFTSLKEATLNKPLVWLTIIGVGVYALYKIGQAIGKKLTLSNADADIKAAQKAGETASYSSATYAQLADKIYAAVMYTWGTDEQAIYDAFNLMKNNIDVANLIKAFGKRRLEFSTQDAELGAHLSNDLDSSEIAKLNSILASKNITYRF